MESKGLVSGNWCLSVRRAFCFSLPLCACFTWNGIAWKLVPESRKIFLVCFHSVVFSCLSSGDRSIGEGGTGRFAKEGLGGKRVVRVWILCRELLVERGWWCRHCPLRGVPRPCTRLGFGCPGCHRSEVLSRAVLFPHPNRCADSEPKV